MVATMKGGETVPREEGETEEKQRDISAGKGMSDSDSALLDRCLDSSRRKDKGEQ